MMSDQNLSIQLCPSSMNSKIFKCTDHATNILERLRTFFQEKELFDIVLIAGIDNVKLQAHRIVLSAMSEYFRTLFCSMFLDAKADTIELKEIDGTTLNLIINFMYTASIELTCETVESVLRAADFLQINILVAACCDFLKEQLNVSNCLGIAFFAEQHNANALYEKAFLFACTHIDKVWSEKQFIHLNSEQLSKFLSSDELCTNSEEEVFRSLVAWFEYDKKNREKCIFNLLSQIRFTLLSAKFITDNRHLICNSTECNEVISSWIRWHLLPESRLQFSIENTKPRKGKQKLTFVSGYFNIKVQTFDPVLNAWSYEELPEPPNMKRHCSVTAINRKLFVVGGEANGLKTNSVECLDLQTMEWTDLPPMGIKRAYAALAELQGKLYVIGGLIDRDWTCSVERYDFATRKWQNVSSLLSPFLWVTVAILNGFLYVVGNDCPSIECYDPNANEWKQISKRKKLNAHGFAAVGEYLYVVGGLEDLTACSTVERYHPSTDTWTVISPLRIPRYGICCVGFNSRLIACGGYDDNGHFNIVEEYNPETDEWNFLGSVLPYELDSFYKNLFTIRV